MSQLHDQTPVTCIALMNEAYQLCRGSNTRAGRTAAEQTLFQCQDQLRQQQIKFHLAPRGEWVLDTKNAIHGYIMHQSICRWDTYYDK